MREIEAKFKLNNTSIINKAKLKKCKEVKVLDVYFDNDFYKLKSQDKVLRLRKENNNYFFAFKSPREKHDDFIIREEIEPTISSFDDVALILKNLNFKEIAKVEKIRIYYKAKKYSKLSITIDKYPFIKNYIEIEGNENDVYQFLKEFNFSLDNTIQKNCAESFVEYCNKNNLPFKNPELNFTFQDEKKYLQKQNN